MRARVLYLGTASALPRITPLAADHPLPRRGYIVRQVQRSRRKPSTVLSSSPLTRGEFFRPTCVRVYPRSHVDYETQRSRAAVPSEKCKSRRAFAFPFIEASVNSGTDPSSRGFFRAIIRRAPHRSVFTFFPLSHPPYRARPRSPRIFLNFPPILIPRHRDIYRRAVNQVFSQVLYVIQ